MPAGSTDTAAGQAVLEAAVAPYLSTSLRDIDLAAVCGDALAAAGVSLADFPTYVAAPDGTKVRLTYASNGPYLEAKLQQFFGQSETPVVGPRRVPVALKLLSPAGKVLAETRDLPHFWKAAYPMVRSEMRGKYPKHPWPEDPANAAPTRLTNRAIANSLPMGDAKTRTSRAPAKQKPGGKRRKRR